MAVNLLVADRWVGRSNDLQYNDAANWDTIEAAIRRPDGRCRGILASGAAEKN